VATLVVEDIFRVAEEQVYLQVVVLEHLPTLLVVLHSLTLAETQHQEQVVVVALVILVMVETMVHLTTVVVVDKEAVAEVLALTGTMELKQVEAAVLAAS
jgi:hypothetical protein